MKIHNNAQFFYVCKFMYRLAYIYWKTYLGSSRLVFEFPKRFRLPSCKRRGKFEQDLKLVNQGKMQT